MSETQSTGLLDTMRRGLVSTPVVSLANGRCSAGLGRSTISNGCTRYLSAGQVIGARDPSTLSGLSCSQWSQILDVQREQSIDMRVTKEQESLTHDAGDSGGAALPPPSALSRSLSSESGWGFACAWMQGPRHSDLDPQGRDTRRPGRFPEFPHRLGLIGVICISGEPVKEETGLRHRLHRWRETGLQPALPHEVMASRVDP